MTTSIFQFQPQSYQSSKQQSFLQRRQQYKKQIRRKENQKYFEKVRKQALQYDSIRLFTKGQRLDIQDKHLNVQRLIQISYYSDQTSILSENISLVQMLKNQIIQFTIVANSPTDIQYFIKLICLLQNVTCILNKSLINEIIADDFLVKIYRKIQKLKEEKNQQSNYLSQKFLCCLKNIIQIQQIRQPLTIVKCTMLIFKDVEMYTERFKPIQKQFFQFLKLLGKNSKNIILQLFKTNNFCYLFECLIQQMMQNGSANIQLLIQFLGDNLQQFLPLIMEDEILPLNFIVQEAINALQHNNHHAIKIYLNFYVNALTNGVHVQNEILFQENFLVKVTDSTYFHSLQFGQYIMKILWLLLFNDAKMLSKIMELPVLDGIQFLLTVQNDKILITTLDLIGLLVKTEQYQHPQQAQNAIVRLYHIRNINLLIEQLLDHKNRKVFEKAEIINNFIAQFKVGSQK